MKYFRKPEIVEAEQIDLRDPVQTSRLRISVYQMPFLEGSVQVAHALPLRIKTGDWLVQPVGTDNPEKRVMSDAEFRSLYAPAQIPAEFQFSPEVYKKLQEHTPEEEAQIREIEKADMDAEVECARFMSLVCKTTDDIFDRVYEIRNQMARQFKSGRRADTLIVNALCGVVAEALARTMWAIDKKEENEKEEAKLALKLRTDIVKFVHGLMRENVKADALFILKMPEES